MATGDIEIGTSDMEGMHDSSLQTIQGVANFKKKLFYPFMTYRDALELLMENSSDVAVYDTWVDKFRNLRLENPNIEFYLLENDHLLFIEDMGAEFTIRVNSIGDIGRMCIYNEGRARYQHFYDFNSDSLIWPFLKGNGILAQISGVMDSGKTDFGCLIVQLLLEKEFNILTNIKFDWKRTEDSELYPGKDTNLHPMTRLSDMILKMIELSEKGERTVILWDETSQFFSRREPGKKSNIQLEKLLRLIRKFRSSIIFVEQIKEGLPGVALEMRTAIYHKEGKKRLQYATRNAERKYNEFFKSVPRTQLPFDTYHKGGFIIDIKLGELFEDVLIEENQDGALKNLILKALKNKSKVKKKRLKKGGRPEEPIDEATLRLYRETDFLTVEETAEKMGRSTNTVNKYRKKYGIR